MPTPKIVEHWRTTSFTTRTEFAVAADGELSPALDTSNYIGTERTEFREHGAVNGDRQ